MSSLDAAYERLHRTGPEFRGWLSNHGPMAAEAMIRRGHGDRVSLWLDDYCRRLEPVPSPISPIGPDWREALGDVRRVTDWTQYFEDALAERPWRIVLNDWWPRLLPGIAAGATHGVIRVGHAVRALLSDGDSPVRIRELAHGLGYWASRWKPVAMPSEPSDAAIRTVKTALNAIPRAEGRGFDEWAHRMLEIPGWSERVGGVRIPEDPEAVYQWLSQVVDEAVVRYLRYGHGDGIMSVHAATAPNAVWRIMPVLERKWWRDSARAAWIAMATLTALYAPATAADDVELAGIAPGGPGAADEAFFMAVEHGDEHVIKFSDTAVDVYARTHDVRALKAIFRAAALISR